MIARDAAQPNTPRSQWPSGHPSGTGSEGPEARNTNLSIVQVNATDSQQQRPMALINGRTKLQFK